MWREKKISTYEEVHCPRCGSNDWINDLDYDESDSSDDWYWEKIHCSKCDNDFFIEFQIQDISWYE